MYNAYFYVSPQTAGLNSAGFPTVAYQCTSPAGTNLASGQIVTISCPTGLSSPPIGTSFSGYVWLNYSSTSGGPTISQKVVTVIVKVS